MFGYIRLELIGNRLDETQDALREFAGFEGFELPEIFLEIGPTTGALWQLTRALKTTQSHDVITPTPTHLDGGGNPERRKLFDALQHEHQTDIWTLNRTEDEAIHRARWRYRDIPASPDAAPAAEPRTLIGSFELHTVPSSVALAQLRIHELLTRAHLRHLVEATEQVVRAVLGEATATAGTIEPAPAIYARLADSFPVLSPPHNILTVWLARTRDALEVNVYETASHAEQPASPAVSAVAHGRGALSSGGTVTWARFPVAAAPAVVPSVLHSDMASNAERAPGRAYPPASGTPARSGTERGHRRGTTHWGTSTSYESPAEAERNAARPAGQHAGRTPAHPSDWNQR